MQPPIARQDGSEIIGRFSFRLIVLVALWVTFLFRKDFSVSNVGGPSVWALLLATVLHVAAQLATALRWAILARPVGCEHPTSRFVRLLFEARFFNVCLSSPVVGDVWRFCGAAGPNAGRSLAACTVVADRAASWASIIVIALTALANRWFSLTPGPTLLLAMGLLVSVLAIISIGMGTVRWLIMWLPKGHELRGLTSRLIPYQARPQLIWQAVGWSFGIQLLNVLSVACLAAGMNIAAPLEAYFMAVPLVALSSARPAHALALTTGGVGFAWFLGSYGVPQTASVALEHYYLLVTLAPALTGGLLYLCGSSGAAWSASWMRNASPEEPEEMDVVRSGRMFKPPPAASAEPVGSISVIAPIYNEVRSIRPLHEALTLQLEGTGRPYEIIFVNDGSTDGSHVALAEVAAADELVKVIELRRNFGQTAALNAGIQMACGDAIVTIDADLQNDPADISPMVDVLEEGYDVVHGWRIDRHDALLSRRIPSVVANWIISKVTHFPVHDLGCTLKVLRREIAQELQLYGEMHRFIPILAHWRGARCAEVVTRHHPRRFGQSKYGISRTIRVILDLITVKYMIQYFTSPMKLFGGIGLASTAIGMLAGAATVLMKLWAGIDMTGNPLLLLTVFATFVGLQFFVLGMLGELCVRTYYESQNKQPYAIRKLFNFDEQLADGREERDIRAA